MSDIPRNTTEVFIIFKIIWSNDYNSWVLLWHCRFYSHNSNTYNEACHDGRVFFAHHNNVIISAMASRITSLTIVFSSVYSGADQRIHQSSASLAFVREIHRWPVNYPHKGPVTRKMVQIDDAIMVLSVQLSFNDLRLWNLCYMHYFVIFDRVISRCDMGLDYRSVCRKPPIIKFTLHW